MSRLLFPEQRVNLSNHQFVQGARILFCSILVYNAKTLFFTPVVASSAHPLSSLLPLSQSASSSSVWYELGRLSATPSTEYIARWLLPHLHVHSADATDARELVSDYVLNGSPMLRRFVVSWLRTVIRQTPSFGNGASSSVSSSSPFDRANTSATAYLANASYSSSQSSSSSDSDSDADQCMRWALELLVSQLHAPLRCVFLVGNARARGKSSARTNHNGKRLQ